MDADLIFPDAENQVQLSLELLYHVSRELASALDLQTVLQRLLQLSLEAVGGSSGSIIVLDDQGNPANSAIVYRGKIFSHTTEQLRVTLEKGLAGWVSRNRRSVLVPNTSEDDRWAKRPDDAPERTGSKSAITVPLLVHQQLVGVMTLVNPNPEAFTESHRTLVQAIADQAATAVLNARMYAESQQTARVMTALAESSIALTAALGTEDILQRVLEQIHHALQVEAVSLALIEPGKDILEFKAATGPAAKSIIGLQLKVGEGIAGWVAQHGEGIIVPNAQEHPLFSKKVDRQTSFETRAIACVPIRSQGQIIGILEAINPVNGVFESDTQLVLMGISSLAGSVIRHGQLIESLQAAQQSFRELFEDSIDPIIITDREGNIVECNRQAALILNISKEVLYTQNIHDIHDVDLASLGGPHFKNLSTSETISYESVVRSKDSEIELPIQVYVRQIVLDDAEYLQWILRDIGERKRLDTLRDDLVSMIYHDLRSPLANVIYSMEVIKSLLPEGDELYLPLIEIAVRSTERIQRLTSSLLDIKKLEAGQPIVDRSIVAISDLFRDAILAVKPGADSKQQQIKTDFSSDLPLIYVDENMIRRVLINLLENAIKFSPREGQISIGAIQVEDGIKVWVQDSGPGIQADKLDLIFEKFTRIDTSQKGLGLGLAFCRMAIEGHGGRIWVDSELGKGSRFNLILPVE